MLLKTRNTYWIASSQNIKITLTSCIIFEGFIYINGRSVKFIHMPKLMKGSNYMSLISCFKNRHRFSLLWCLLYSWWLPGEEIIPTYIFRHQFRHQTQMQSEAHEVLCGVREGVLQKAAQSRHLTDSFALGRKTSPSLFPAYHNSSMTYW